MKSDTLTLLSLQAKLKLLEIHYHSKVGHIGGNLSCLDILLTLHHRIMQDNQPFILSKGHAVGAMYITLWTLGKLSDDDLKTFHHEDTMLPGHPPTGLGRDILFPTGSLGHGFSLANGVALANKFSGTDQRVFCLTSDGEWQEGSTWEALIFAIHHRLNITVLIDGNGLQGFGSTSEVAGMNNLPNRIKSFGVDVAEINGHDIDQIEKECKKAETGLNIIYAHTIKGNGVSFMEKKMEWHYLPLNDELYAQAVSEISGSIPQEHIQKGQNKP